jgi:glycosyltransferase involved in cell wall biosynthesis
LRIEYPLIRLTIAGTGHARFPTYEGEMKARFQKMGGVNWLGQVEEDHVQELFRRAQIVVLPYTASTGSSSVLYQSATWGRAVVASDLNETQQLVRESNLRVTFFKSGDVQCLHQTICQLLDSPEERRRQIVHNFNAIQRTRPSETCRKYIHAFNRALEKRQSSKRIEIPLIENQPA